MARQPDQPPSRQPDQPPPAPVACRVRIRYAKRGRLRFCSHRDFARAFERALRRADVPMAYSAGFTPHPKVSYVGAAPTGVASEAEYVEIALTEVVDPEQVLAALDASLPPGLDLLEAVTATGGGSLPDRIEASVWRLRLAGVPAEQLASAVAALLALPAYTVERVTKAGRKLVDVRAALVDTRVEAGESVADAGDCAILHAVVRQHSPAVRPDDLLAALRQIAGLVPPRPAEVTRCAQGRLGTAGQVADPLAPDRAAALAAEERPA